MTTAVSKANLQSLPEVLLLHTLSFLEPQDVALTERTCRAWKKSIGSEKQTLWKEICRRDQIPAEKATSEELAKTNLGSHKYGDWSFTQPLLGCIAAYAVSYKEHASFLRANLLFYGQTMYLDDRSRLGRVFENCHWGDLDEPFANMNLGSLAEDRPLHPALEEFPRFVPLRLLMDREGNYKKEGDQVRVIFKTQRLILTCKHCLHFSDHRPVESWEESITERVRISLSCRFISQRSLRVAQELAKTAPEWIDADYTEIT